MWMIFRVNSVCVNGLESEADIQNPDMSNNNVFLHGFFIHTRK